MSFRYTILLVLTLGLLASGVSGQSPDPPDKTLTEAGQMADTVTSDAPVIETTTYFVALLRRGPAWTAEPDPDVQKIQEDHLRFIDKMTDSGLIVLSGPFLVEDDANALEAMYVYKMASLEDAQNLVREDPAVEADRYTVEVIPWLGPLDLSYRHHAKPTIVEDE